MVVALSTCDNVPLLKNDNWLLTPNSGVVVLVTVVVVEVSVVLLALVVVPEVELSDVLVTL